MNGESPTDLEPGPLGEPLAVLAGPTASGKTALGVEVARRAGAEVLSMDSMLVYRGLDVGTAKPTAGERADVPHHLIDLVEPELAFSVQDWLARAQAVLAQLAQRRVRALFVGGTAFYLKALTEGLFEGPAVDRELRAALEARFDADGGAGLHAELGRVDPPSAARLHPHDRKRIVRALEVWEQTGRPLSDWQRQWGAAPARARRIVALDVPAWELEERIVRRTRDMLAGGWVEEVRALDARGALGPTASQALGYAEVRELGRGRLEPAEAEARIVLRTRQFARKQRTWLRGFADRIEVAAPRPGDPADMQRAASETLTALGWSSPRTF